MSKSYNKKIPNLYTDKKDCCGCRACMNVCPMNAISMKMDEYGFNYPEINEKVCIGCNKCVNSCAFQKKEEQNVPIKSYAAVSKQEEVLKKCASGGIFTTLATYVIEKQGGIAYGAAYDESWNVQHIGIETVKDLYKLQGSKYVQSDTNVSYQDVKKELEKGRVVLYSGTPCQIAGLYGYLGKKYSNLITVDLVCHGVPSTKMFKEYIALLENKYKGRVVNFNFRDKTKGWAKNASCIIDTGEETKKIDLWQSESSYLYYFSESYLFRDSCYNCKYTSKNRPADITIGDFWGIENVHPEILRKRGWDEKKGISLIIVNTLIGECALNEITDLLMLEESSFENMAKYNHQLKEPSKAQPNNVVIELYKKEGWESVDNRFNKVIGLRKYSSRIKSLLPSGIKNLLKRLKG